MNNTHQFLGVQNVNGFFDIYIYMFFCFLVGGKEELLSWKRTRISPMTFLDVTFGSMIFQAIHVQVLCLLVFAGGVGR